MKNRAVLNQIHDLEKGAELLIDFAKEIKIKAMALRNEVSCGRDTSDNRKSLIEKEVLKMRRLNRLRK